MNYWFLYHITDGSLYGSPYLGDVEEWKNIPDGCGVLGPIVQSNTTAMDAFINPECYTVQNVTLTPLPNIADIKAQKELERQRQASMPTELELLREENNSLKQENSKISTDLQGFMDYFFVKFPE